MAQPIIDAVKSGDFAAVTTLLKGNEDVEETDGNGATALFWAALKGDEPLVDLLLQHGADPFVEDSLHENSITWAALSGHATIVTILRERGVPLTLMAACLLGETATVEQFVCEGADVNRKTAHGTTPLLWAAQKGHVETVRALLRLGADINARDEFGCALLHAAHNGHIALVAALIERGWDVNAQCQLGPAISLAAVSGHTEGCAPPASERRERSTHPTGSRLRPLWKLLRWDMPMSSNCCSPMARNTSPHRR